MIPKTTPSKRKPNPATNNLEPARAAIARVARICPPTGRGVASTKKLPPYIIDSVEMDVLMESPTGKSPVQRARVTYVIDCMTANVMAATVHFEPCCDLASSGGYSHGGRNGVALCA